MKVIVKGTVAIPAMALTDAQFAEDSAALSCPNPAREAASRRGDPMAWKIPERVSSLQWDGTYVHYPIGAAEVYRPRIRELGLEVVDERPVFEPEPISFDGKLLPFQAEAAKAMLATKCCTVVGPCGAGKSELISYIIGALGLPTLLIVHTKDLADDLRSRITKRLGVEVGLIGDGVRDIKRITVALIQSIDLETLALIKDKFGAVIVDECHHAAADTYQTVLSALEVRHRYGLTATPERADGLRPFVHHQLGPVAHEITREDLVAAGRSVLPTFRTVHTEFDFPYKRSAQWPKLLAALETDKDRDALVTKVVAEQCAGELTAVCVGRVDHATRLADAMTSLGLRAVALHGKLPKSRRAAILDEAREGAVDVIVGTSLLDEGIDLPRLSRVVLAWPAKSASRIVQRIGRALRVCEGKAAPIVFDIVDSHVGVLRHQARARARIFSQFRSEAA